MKYQEQYQNFFFIAKIPEINNIVSLVMTTFIHKK